MPQNPLPPPIVLKYVTRHKETTHEIYVLGAYFYERTSEGDYIRMKEVPEWLHDTVKENDIKTIIYHDEVFIDVNIAYNDLKIINYDTKEIVFEFPITEFENIFNG